MGVAMNGNADKQRKVAGTAPQLFRYVPRVVLLLFAVLIVVYLAWTFLGGASVSSTRLVPSKPGASPPSQPVADMPGDKGREKAKTAADRPAAPGAQSR